MWKVEVMVVWAVTGLGCLMASMGEVPGGGSEVCMMVVMFIMSTLVWERSLKVRVVEWWLIKMTKVLMLNIIY